MTIILNIKKLPYSFILTLLCIGTSASSQIIISGKVYDSTKLFAVPGVVVQSSSGTVTQTDSAGDYHITVLKSDSITFLYQGKLTRPFAVKDIQDYNSFDLSLHVRVKNKYKLLKGVTVFSNSYRQDSLENREEFAKLFGSSGSGFHTTYDPGGTAGLDLDALVKSFRFRKNKQDRAFRNLLIQEEQEKYVDYRFSSKTISRITGLKGEELEKYKKVYRPSYYFVANSTLVQFYEYILKTSYDFKAIEGIK